MSVSISKVKYKIYGIPTLSGWFFKVTVDRQKIIKSGKVIYKAWRWLVWGLRWLAVLVFSILLVVGIGFKLPWKMLVCIAVIPVVGIFVPKKIQPWVWMSLTIIILAAWGWVKLPDTNSKDWQMYQFDGDLEELQADRQIAPGDNAATKYQQLFETYGDSIFNYHFISDEADRMTLVSPWNRQDYPLLAEWVQTYEPAIEALLEISRVPQCGFDIPHDLPTMDIQMERINRLKGWANLMIRSANLDLVEDRSEKALEKQLAVLNMAQHLYQQKTLFDQAGAFHLELLAARALQIFMIEQCDDVETLKMIEEQFSQLDPGWAKNWVIIVDREKLIVKNILASFYEINKEGDTRIAHRAMFALQEVLGYTPRALFFQQHEMDRLAVIGLWLSLPASPEGVAGIVDERFDHYSLQSQKGTPLPNIPIQYSWTMGLNVRSIIDWLAIERVKYFWALHGQNSRHLAVVNLMRIFSALKKYHLQNNHWPDTLEQLKPELTETVLLDPVHGKPFAYQTTQDGFLLYSLGPNGIDDNGANDPQQNKDDIVFWPRPTTAESFNGDLLPEKTPK